MAPYKVNTSFLVRHVRFLKPDLAVAVGLRRSRNVKPPFDAGTIDYLLVKEDGRWKIAVFREGMALSPDAFPGPASPVPVRQEGLLSQTEKSQGWISLFDGVSNAGWLTLAGKAEMPPAWEVKGV